MAGLTHCSRTRAGVMAKYPGLQEVREGMAIKKHHCAPELLVPTTSHTAAMLPAPRGGDKALCFHRLLPQHHVRALLSPPRPGSHCCAGWGQCMHPPAIPFSVLTIRPNNLPEANFSPDAEQEAPELHLPAPGRAGRIPGHDLYSAQSIFGKAGCGLQGVDLSHHHIAQQP